MIRLEKLILWNVAAWGGNYAIINKQVTIPRKRSVLISRQVNNNLCNPLMRQIQKIRQQKEIGNRLVTNCKFKHIFKKNKKLNDGLAMNDFYHWNTHNNLI